MTKRKIKPEDANDLERCQWIEGEARSRCFCQRPTVTRTHWCREHLERVYDASSPIRSAT